MTKRRVEVAVEEVGYSTQDRLAYARLYKTHSNNVSYLTFELVFYKRRIYISTRA